MDRSCGCYGSGLPICKKCRRPWYSKDFTITPFTTTDGRCMDRIPISNLNE